MIQDHLGNQFKSKTKMCRFYNISTSAFNRRMKKGWSLEKALTTTHLKKQYTDHLGNTFTSLQAMADYWKIPSSTLEQRLKKMSIKEALTIQPGYLRGKTIKDHTGKIWPSITAMCKNWGISTALYHGRIKCGYTIEKALTEPITKQPRNSKPAIDHQGNIFGSKSEMCRYWGIKLPTYRARMNEGWSLEKTLTTPPKKINSMQKQLWVDPFGNTFESLNAMCKQYKLTHHSFRSRINDYNWPLAEALNIIPHITYKTENLKIFKNFTILYNIKDEKQKPTIYFKIKTTNNEETIMTHNGIIEYCLEILKKEKQDATTINK